MADILLFSVQVCNGGLGAGMEFDADTVVGGFLAG